MVEARGDGVSEAGSTIRSLHHSAREKHGSKHCEEYLYTAFQEKNSQTSLENKIH